MGEIDVPDCDVERGALHACLQGHGVGEGAQIAGSGKGIVPGPFLVDIPVHPEEGGKIIHLGSGAVAASPGNHGERRGAGD